MKRREEAYYEEEEDGGEEENGATMDEHEEEVDDGEAEDESSEAEEEDASSVQPSVLTSLSMTDERSRFEAELAALAKAREAKALAKSAKVKKKEAKKKAKSPKSLPEVVRRTRAHDDDSASYTASLRTIQGEQAVSEPNRRPAVGFALRQRLEGGTRPGATPEESCHGGSRHEEPPADAYVDAYRADEYLGDLPIPWAEDEAESESHAYQLAHDTIRAPPQVNARDYMEHHVTTSLETYADQIVALQLSSLIQQQQPPPGQSLSASYRSAEQLMSQPPSSRTPGLESFADRIIAEQLQRSQRPQRRRLPRAQCPPPPLPNCTEPPPAVLEAEIAFV